MATSEDCNLAIDSPAGGTERTRLPFGTCSGVLIMGEISPWRRHRGRVAEAEVVQWNTDEWRDPCRSDRLQHRQQVGVRRQAVLHVDPGIVDARRADDLRCE